MIGKKLNLYLKSKRHLTKSKETWGRHCVFAFFAGVKLIYSGIASIIHGLVPAFFEGTAAITIIHNIIAPNGSIQEAARFRIFESFLFILSLSTHNK